MDIGEIDGFTRALGAPPNWNHERDGKCGALPILDGFEGGVPTMTSEWKPTAEEIEAIKAGAPIRLRICGFSHPPVMLSVGGPPK